MASAYHVLLDATVAHLEDLRLSGVRTVEVSMATMEGLCARPAETRTSLPVPPSGSPTRVLSARGISGEGIVHPKRMELPTVPSISAAPRAHRPFPVVPPANPSDSTDVSAPIPSPLPRDRGLAMAEIRHRALACGLCPHLARSRTQVVFGVGSVEAELMFIGEAPGAEEDRQGEPFVGPAGQLLTRVIGAMGFTRQTVYIANILKCRPDISPGSRGNRPPRPEEMDTCKPYLASQVEIVRPKVIVALGLTAVQGLLGLKTSMGSVRGRWQVFRGIPVMPTFHPSYLLRSEDGPDRGFSEKRKTWEDMLEVLEKLGKPITGKMREYFLRPSS